MIRGVAGVMVSSDAWASHGFPGLHQGFDNIITYSDSRATNENSLVPRCEDGIMDDEEYVSSSMKLLETLQAVKDDARVVPNFEEQLQVLDHAINSSPVLSNLKTKTWCCCNHCSYFQYLCFVALFASCLCVGYALILMIL